nr:hypothetical protein [Tanacetum cinerariifolium]
MILESVENGPLIWPTIEENGVTGPRKYSELSPTDAIQGDYDVKETNIILQGLPPEIYELVNNHKVAKDLWERIQLLMQGTSLTKQKREYVKLVQDLHTSNIDQLHAYLGQHEFHAIEVCLMHELFKKGDDPIDAINHMMLFLSAVVTSRYPMTNNQLRNLSNPKQQAIINNGRVTLQLVHGRKFSIATGEGHMSKQCTKPKRKWDVTWFKDKVFLVQAQVNGQILHEEELAFLADPGIEKCLKLETELLNKKDLIEKETYDKLFRRYTTLEKHCISLEVDTQLNQENFQMDNSVSNQSAPNFDQYFELNELKAQSQDKDTVIRKLKERIKSLSGNVNEDKAHSGTSSILREVVEQGKSQNPLNNSLDSALAVTPKNKDKRVRFTEPITPLGNTNTQTDSSSNLVSNKPLLSSTGVKPSTSASGSHPSGNTKKDKIQQPPSSTQKNKVEAYPRTVKSSLKSKNCVVEPKGTAIV